jgi:cytochrome b561
LILLALHMGSALWHQFIHRDGLLGRIWPRLDDRA